MEIIKQYVVYDKQAGAYHILFETANGYYRSSTGAFNQRDKREPVTFFLVNALKYLAPKQRAELANALLERTETEGE